MRGLYGFAAVLAFRMARSFFYLSHAGSIASFHPQTLRKAATMLRNLFSIALAIVSLIPAAAQSLVSDADVSVTASLQPIDADRAELLVTATIADGLHIYAQSQPKPFLASRISISGASTGIFKAGTFTADREPIRIQHESLGVELHEYEGSVQWRTEISLTQDLSDVVVRGTLFAQACEADRCFAPKTYDFTAKIASAVAGVDQMASVASIADASSPTAETTTTDNAPAEAASAAEAFSISQFQVTPDTDQSAWSVIPLAFVAGFLLNFMPCVLPVVGLKLISFVQQANSDRKRILLMNLAYTAGLLSVMMVLASLAVFAGFGWGQQFSSAAFTVTLSAIVFAFGLSFLGVWEIPLPGFVGNADGQTKQEGYAGAFSKGILSTLLATPCSGPFLGAALAWAVTQPSYLTFSVFASVGLGMASPYLVVGVFPSTIRFLPKPGNWMVTFKQVMGFIMLTTVIYLISFMPVASVVPTVLLLLGIAMAVWFAARTPLYAPTGQQIKAWSIATSMIVLTAVVSFGWLQGVMQTRFERAAARLLEQTHQGVELASNRSASDDLIAWKTYSPELFESIVQSGQPVFVDFTADWCLTCQSNEASAIETTQVAAAIRDSGAIALRADKTQPNPAVDELLRRLGNSAASIPFYAVFPAGNPAEPILLDGVFASPQPFVKALQSSKATLTQPL